VSFLISVDNYAVSESRDIKAASATRIVLSHKLVIFDEATNTLAHRHVTPASTLFYASARSTTPATSSIPRTSTSIGVQPTMSDDDSAVHREVSPEFTSNTIRNPSRVSRHPHVPTSPLFFGPIFKLPTSTSVQYLLAELVE
jgi:hypothetical protein